MEDAIAHAEDASDFIEDAIDLIEDVTSHIAHRQHAQRLQQTTCKMQKPMLGMKQSTWCM